MTETEPERAGESVEDAKVVVEPPTLTEAQINHLKGIRAITVVGLKHVKEDLKDKGGVMCQFGIRDAEFKKWEAINWGDLHVCEIQWVIPEEGPPHVLVIVEEATCQVLAHFLTDYLKAAGYAGVYVQTEW